jgi:hypothetical protein
MDNEPRRFETLKLEAGTIVCAKLYFYTYEKHFDCC